ncbi:hypothetical protein [Pseudomonas helleri]|uniref:hypothetical protein n=1 Tax=Pseudomonas helleri TaxID=1608996 RepID=UPI002430ABCA|nr:hypothetical protein [Pseudomonas helleri]
MKPSEKLCPQCAETIKSQAVKCRFCGSDLALEEKSNAGIPARRILYSMGLAAFIVSGMDLAGAPYGSSRQAEGYLLTVISIALMVTGIVVQVAQRKAGDKRSDGTFWSISIAVTTALIFIGMLAIS